MWQIDDDTFRRQFLDVDVVLPAPSTSSLKRVTVWVFVASRVEM